MLDYLKGIWKCRYFWMSLVKIDLRARYRRSVLGLGWSLLHPIAMTAILCTVFGKIIMPEGDILSYGPFLLAGLATWSFFVTATLSGCQCFFQGESYIRQYPAPMAIYPLRSALGAMIHFLIAMAIVLAAAFVFKGTSLDRLAALIWLLPGMLMLFVFGWSLAVLAGLATVYFQDTQHLCEVGFQGMMYLTPVIYPAELLKARGLDWLVNYNPFAALLDLVRCPVLDGTMAAGPSYMMASWTVVVVFAAASLTLARCQRHIIFHL